MGHLLKCGKLLFQETSESCSYTTDGGRACSQRSSSNMCDLGRESGDLPVRFVATDKNSDRRGNDNRTLQCGRGIHSFVSVFDSVSFSWIPRERNVIADALAKAALIVAGTLVVEDAFIAPN